MLGVAAESGRGAKLAALTVPVLLAAAALATYRTAGALAALSLVASLATIVLVALVVATRRRLHHAREHAQLGLQALDAVPDAIFVTAERPGAPNVLVNAAYAALTGYGAREATADGFDARAIFAEGGMPALEHDADRSSTRVVVRRRDGTTFPAKVDLRAVPRGEGGRYLVGTIEDVTFGERAMDREAPPQVDPPSPGAREDVRPSGLFLSWLCHELRSPLNACLMWLDVLALGPQPDKLPKAIEAIKRGLARQAKLVSDLSDAAKVAAGGLEMRFERVDLVALTASAVGAWQLLAIGKQLKFQQRIELAAASVDGDAERLLAALNQLVENAINSTPAQGQVDVRVRGGREVCAVEVEDTGPALSAEDAAHLAAPLARWPSSAKARSGLGLGLAVAHHVATRHGGTLTAATEGSSTRFVLTLPLAASAASDGPPTGGDTAASGAQISNDR